jgi:hypothetical protein
MRTIIRVFVAAGLTPIALYGLARAATTTHPVIGVVQSSGDFEVASITAHRTASILNGDQIKSHDQTSHVALKSGTTLDFAPGSNGTVYQNHVELASGTLSSHLGPAFDVRSATFDVKTTGTATVAAQTGEHALMVKVVAGNADVLNSGGVVLAHMTAGTTLNFNALGSSAPALTNGVRMVGVIAKENSHFLIRDRFTNTVAEVQGNVPEKDINQLVMVEGTFQPSEHSTVAQVDKVVHMEKISRSDAAIGAPCLPDGSGGIAKIVHLIGSLGKVRNHYIVKDRKQGNYELIGNVSDSEVGQNVNVRGFVLNNVEPVAPAEKVVFAEARKYIIAASPCAGLIAAGSLITTGTLVYPKEGSAAAASTVTKPVSF